MIVRWFDYCTAFEQLPSDLTFLRVQELIWTWKIARIKVRIYRLDQDHFLPRRGALSANLISIDKVEATSIPGNLSIGLRCY
jgi:hypothetical protein